MGGLELGSFGGSDLLAAIVIARVFVKGVKAIQGGQCVVLIEAL